MWEIDNGVQAGAFFWAIALGGGLCVLYDLFRLDRMIFRRATVTVIVADILFWILAAFSVFCLLLLTTNGQVRSFILVGVLIGFWIWRLTFSRVLNGLSRPFKKAVRTIRLWYGKGTQCLAKGDQIFISLGRFFKKCFHFPKKEPFFRKKMKKTTCNPKKDCV